jgi:hypothetical protein
MPLERARRSVSASLAAELGLGERLVGGEPTGSGKAAASGEATGLRSTA